MITVIASVLLGENFILLIPNIHLFQIFNSIESLIPFSKECYRATFINYTFKYVAITVYIPIHEFIIYPVLHKYFPSIKMYQKFALGMLLQIARVVTLMAFDITARNKYIEQYKRNITCLLLANEVDYGLLSTSFNSYLTIISQLLESLSLILLSI